MGKDFVIRGLRFEDFEGVVKNYWTYYSELKKNRELGLVLFRKKPALKEELNWFVPLYKACLSGDAIALVAVVGKEIVGSCEVKRGRPGSDADHIGNFGLAVRDGFRSQGIGKALLSAAIDKSRGKFKKITLVVLENNKKAIGLYKKFGFRKYGFLPDAVRRGDKKFNDVLMYLELD